MLIVCPSLCWTAAALDHTLGIAILLGWSNRLVSLNFDSIFCCSFKLFWLFNNQSILVIIIKSCIELWFVWHLEFIVINWRIGGFKIVRNQGTLSKMFRLRLQFTICRIYHVCTTWQTSWYTTVRCVAWAPSLQRWAFPANSTDPVICR